MTFKMAARLGVVDSASMLLRLNAGDDVITLGVPDPRDEASMLLRLNAGDDLRSGRSLSHRWISLQCCSGSTPEMTTR